jgi:putative phosphoribosyl transferase
VSIAIDARTKVSGLLCVPDKPVGIVILAHVASSSRNVARNRDLAQALQREKLCTLLLDLLSPREEEGDRFRGKLLFDIPLLAGRLILTNMWLRRQPDVFDLPVGIFGANTGGAAALVAAAHQPDRIRAVVTRGGRLDLVPDDDVAELRSPTLVIVGGADVPILAATRSALPRFPLSCQIALEIVPGASHLFERPGALDQVSSRASAWFRRELSGEEAITVPIGPVGSRPARPSRAGGTRR